MSNRRSIYWLLFAIAVMAAMHFVLDLGGTPAAMLRREVLVPKADRASEIVIGRSEGAAFRFVRDDSGWWIDRPFRVPADRHGVERLLDRLAFAPTADALSDSELLKLGRTRDKFLLDERSDSVTVIDGGRTNRVSFGDHTPAGDGVYAAVDDVDAVFVVPTNVVSAVDSPIDDFRVRALTDGTADSVRIVEIRSGGSFSRFERQGAEWWMTQSQPRQPASAIVVQELLRAVCGATASHFVWPTGVVGESPVVSESMLAGYGLGTEDAVTVTLVMRNGTSSVVAFGKEAGDGLVFALVHGGAEVVTVPATLRDAFAADASVFADTRLFPFEESAVTSFSVSDGEVMCLVAREQDGPWRIDAPVSAPADQQTVETLLKRLLELRRGDLEPSGLAVAVNGTDATGVVPPRAFGDLRLEDLRSKEILRLDPAGVRRVVLTTAGHGRPTAVVRDFDRRTWNVDVGGREGPVDPVVVEEILQQLNPLTASGIVKLKASAAELAEFGLETPLYTMAVDRVADDAVRRNLLVGKNCGTGFYATIGASDAVFKLDADVVSRLMRDPVGK